MPEYLAPGVFIEEIDSGSKPIEGVGVNTAAFIGYAKSGEFNTPKFVTNWSQFCQLFGEEENALLTALSAELKTSAAELLAGKRASRKGWLDYARGLIDGAIKEKKGDSKKHEGLTVKSWPEFLKNHGIPTNSLPYMEGSYLAHAVRGYYDNGGARAYIVRVARDEDLKVLALGPEGAAKVAHAIAGPLTIRALNPGKSGNDIKVEVSHVGDGHDFRVKISQEDVVRGEFPLEPDKGLPLDQMVNVVNQNSEAVGVRFGLSPAPEAAPAPKPGARVQAVAARPQAKVFNLIGGADVTQGGVLQNIPASLKDLGKARSDDFIGDEAQRTGTEGLAALDNVNMICAPDLMAGAWEREKLPGNGALGPEVLALDDNRRQQILDWQCAMVAYCERMADRMAILDALPGLTPDDMRTTTLNTPYNCDRGQAAIYYPWIKIADPLHKGQQMFVPPSGHIAGVWARVGVERGVHKAPANEALMGALALEWDVTKPEQEILNPEGVNCIRSFPGQGIRVWGARTLATVGNPSWKYVNVRRLFNYLEKSMERGMQWVVFEPNDQDLWGRVRRNLAAFLWTEWKEGKLFGATPSEAFYVKCDAETNPQEMIDLGRLYVEIGVNPVKPAEFVIVRMGQWSGGGSMSEQ